MIELTPIQHLSWIVFWLIVSLLITIKNSKVGCLVFLFWMVISIPFSPFLYGGLSFISILSQFAMYES